MNINASYCAPEMPVLTQPVQHPLVPPAVFQLRVFSFSSVGVMFIKYVGKECLYFLKAVSDQCKAYPDLQRPSKPSLPSWCPASWVTSTQLQPVQIGTDIMASRLLEGKCRNIRHTNRHGKFRSEKGGGLEVLPLAFSKAFGLSSEGHQLEDIKQELNSFSLLWIDVDI